VRVGGGRRGVYLHHAGPGGEQLAEAHRELVEVGAEHHCDVSPADGLHGAGRTPPTGHPEVELGAREDPAAQ